MIRLLRTWRRQRTCFHHDHHTGRSWVGRGHIIDYRKLYRCSNCDKVWVI